MAKEFKVILQTAGPGKLTRELIDEHVRAEVKKRGLILEDVKVLRRYVQTTESGIQVVVDYDITEGWLDILKNGVDEE